MPLIFFSCIMACPAVYLNNKLANYCMIDSCEKKCITCDSTN